MPRRRRCEVVVSRFAHPPSVALRNLATVFAAPEALEVSQSSAQRPTIAIDAIERSMPNYPRVEHLSTIDCSCSYRCTMRHMRRWHILTKLYVLLAAILGIVINCAAVAPRREMRCRATGRRELAHFVRELCAVSDRKTRGSAIWPRRR